MVFDKDFNSYVHQKVQDISDYFSSELTCDVKLENIKKQLKKLFNADEYSYEKVKNKKICMSVFCEDQGFKIKATGFADNEYDALNEAFIALEKQLREMLDEQVSEKSRVKQISDSFLSNQLKH